MLAPISPNQARYVAELIVSIIGVVALLGLFFWLINRGRKSSRAGEAQPLPARHDPAKIAPGYAPKNRRAEPVLKERAALVASEFQAWQRRYLLQSEDGKSLFVRDGVEKSGLRYQFAATAQTQALAMLVFTQLAGFDLAGSAKFEALFASLLAHPAADAPELSSWKYLPDLPRSPRLEADLTAEGWALLSLLLARRQWQGLDRFNYAEIIPLRAEVLINAWQKHAPQDQIFHPLLRRMLTTPATQKISTCLSQISAIPENDLLELSDRQKVGLDWLEIGLEALIHDDPTCQELLARHQSRIEGFFDSNLGNLDQAYGEAGGFSNLSLVACLVPGLLELKDTRRLDQTWQALTDTVADKNDGAGATLRLLALALNANLVWLE